MEDVPELVAHLLSLEERRTGVRRAVSPAVMARLCGRRWPGNVRELSNEIARLCALSSGDLTDPGLVRTDEPAAVVPDGAPLAEVERRMILATLERVGGDKEEAARQLGISRSKIYQRLRQWGVGAPAAQD